VDCHDQNYLALPGGPCGYKAKSESEETKSLVWLTKCFGAGCGKSLARVLLKEAVVVLGCRFCVPRAINTVFKAKKRVAESADAQPGGFGAAGKPPAPPALHATLDLDAAFRYKNLILLP
jgi:hypothetical protein